MEPLIHFEVMTHYEGAEGKMETWTCTLLNLIQDGRQLSSGTTQYTRPYLSSRLD